MFVPWLFKDEEEDEEPLYLSPGGGGMQNFESNKASARGTMTCDSTWRVDQCYSFCLSATACRLPASR
jgi:hypothetical protein